MHTKLVRTPALYLVGFMGSGKTTVGALLADDLGWDFVDLDDDIEAAAGHSISGIFASQGEPEFRHFEHEALLSRVHAAQNGWPLVLSLGGGAFAQENNFQLVQANGISIWLDAPLDLVRRRIGHQNHRPLARNPEQFDALFHARQVAYARADFRIEITSDDPAHTVRAILSLPLF